MTSLENIKKSRVLVRVGYDLANFQETSRIQDSLKTIQRLLKNGNKILVITHWGRPEGFDPELSTEKLLPLLKTELIKVKINSAVAFWDQFANDFDVNSLELEINKADIIFLQNSRFEGLEKSKKSEERMILAQKYSKLAQFYVDEAFSVSHRQESTNSEIKELLPSFLGISYSKEENSLNKLKKNPDRPFSIIMAGAKLETKLPLISKMLTLADQVFLGGKLAFTFIQAGKDLNIEDYFDLDLKDSEIETDFYDQAKELLFKHTPKIFLPVDLIYGQIKDKTLALDIGPKTVDNYLQKLELSKTIFWNGTMGYYEKPPFNNGTETLARALGKLNQAYKVVGGGDTITALSKEILNNFDFVSMGGGATLDFLAS